MASPRTSRSTNGPRTKPGGIEAKIILTGGFDGRYLRIGRTPGETKGLNIVDTIEKPFRLKELSGLLQKLFRDDILQKAS